jgi:recombination protein RecT
MAAVATSRPAIDPIAGIVKVVESPNLKIQIARALPKAMDLDRFMRICVTNIRNRHDLQRCEPLSLVSSIVEASQLGLELDPILGHGYLVPFRRKDGKYICTFIPGYRGFIHLMRNSGLVHLVNAEIIVVGDEHDEMLGTQRRLHHKPIYDNKVDRLVEKNWLGAYCTVTWTNNGQPDYEYMHAEAINDIRKRSPAERAGKKGPWVTDTAEMWKKTPTRRTAKRMPLSPQTRQLIKAATRDEYRESEAYREKEPMTAVLDDIDVQPVERIEVITETKEPEKETPQAKSETKPAKNETRKKGKGSAESATSKDEKTQPVKFISAGRQEAFRCLAMDERAMTHEEYINFLGSMGYEKPEQIEDSKWLKVWEALSREKRYR